MTAQVTAVQGALATLYGQMKTQQGRDVTNQAQAKSNEVTQAQAQVTALIGVGSAQANWDATVQQKINDTLDYIEICLTIVGLIPGVGIATSVASSFISLLRGNYLSAALSAIGAIPVLGEGATAAKLSRLGASAATRAANAAAAASRIATIGRNLLELKAAASGSVVWKIASGAYNFVFCKALRLACFEAGTPIECEHGSVPVEKVQVGDRVWSRSEHDPEGPVELKVVEEVFERYALIIRLELPGGVKIGTTAEHPFWVVGRGWVPAGEIRVGDVFVGRDGREVAVEGVENTGSYVPVYNFCVEEYHTYFIGGERCGFSVWAHNAKGACTPAVNLAQKQRTFQTYTKTNPVTGEVYAGRSSGFGTPAQNLARRESRGHDWTARGFGPPVLDKSSTNAAAIRGREQMLKDYFKAIGKGVAQDEPISSRNKNRAFYLAEALRVFGII